MKRLKVTIAGPALLMHNGQLANPLNPYTKALKEITGKSKKSDDDLIELARREFQGGLYHEDDIGPFLPGEMVLAMIIAGSRNEKKGREFVEVDVEEDRVPLEYDGPRDRAGLWKDPKARFVLTVGAGQNRKRIMRTRPIFRNWRATFTVVIEDGASVNVDNVRSALEFASRRVGLGDWRPGSPKGGRYGRFVIEEFKELGRSKSRAA